MKMNQFLQKFPALQILFCVAVPLSLLNCKNGKNGMTPIVTVVGAECTYTADALRVVLVNAFNVDARIAEYNYRESFSPTTISTIQCTSGTQFWYNTSPVIIEARKVVTASLSCGVNDDEGEIAGCNIESAQPISCYINPIMDSPTQSYGTINISTIRCVNDITPLTHQSVDSLLGTLHSSSTTPK